MKARYLFPLIFVVVDALSLLFINFPGIPILISSISTPSSFVMGIVTRAFGVPSDPANFAYFVGVGTILQMFLLGLLWEFLVGKIQKLFRKDRVL